jgi:hypothetical protein
MCSPSSDGDSDVEGDATDRCPGTPPAEEVDDAGCSVAQFCAAFDATSRDGARQCKKADWKNDEPFMRTRDADCLVDKRGTRDVADDLCVPIPG